MHISAVIGINIGYPDWFISKTPFNLLLIFASLLFFYPLTKKQLMLLFIIFFVAGMAAELIGVNTGFLFGDYHYGNNLGPKIGGVPLLIGINWAVLVVCCGEIAGLTKLPAFGKAVIGATLMVFLDFFIEPLAPAMDFWYWTTADAPIFNYATWFVIAFLLTLVFQKKTTSGNATLAINIYLTQLVFFGSLYVTRSI